MALNIIFMLDFFSPESFSNSVLVSFATVKKYLRKIINVKEKRCVLAHSFICFSLWSLDCGDCCGTASKQNIMVWRSKAAHLMAVGKQREEGARDKVYTLQEGPE
jgi:hypothetical protein